MAETDGFGRGGNRSDGEKDSKAARGEDSLDAVRPDLHEVIERHAFGLDERRPDVVARRRLKNQRTARANIEDLCDPGRFIEYGALAVSAQRQRRSLEDLISKTPADGLIAGIGTINGSLFGSEKARCMVMAYDYSVLAGTQGYFNHKKMDRMLKLAYEERLPLVLFAEGGGGRPSDVDAYGVVAAGLDVPTFASFARLSGRVPLVGVVSGPCFAGNAALLGCCDVIIAARNSNIGMGGPAMIEGGGLGVYKPEEIGPIDVQTRNGLGAMAMAKGGFHEPVFTVSWPTGEYGGMGLEGAVKAGFKKELEAIRDPKEREALYNQLVAAAYERGKAINMASYLEIDAVIDPADTRKWILDGLRAASPDRLKGSGHGFVDPW